MEQEQISPKYTNSFPFHSYMTSICILKARKKDSRRYEPHTYELHLYVSLSVA
jgi:hypothetical protein